VCRLGAAGAQTPAGRGRGADVAWAPGGHLGCDGLASRQTKSWGETGERGGRRDAERRRGASGAPVARSHGCATGRRRRRTGCPPRVHLPVTATGRARVWRMTRAKTRRYTLARRCGRGACWAAFWTHLTLTHSTACPDASPAYQPPTPPAPNHTRRGLRPARRHAAPRRLPALEPAAFRPHLRLTHSSASPDDYTRNVLFRYTPV